MLEVARLTRRYGALTAIRDTEDVGAIAGAAYSPDGEIVPTVEFPPATPFTCQLTVVFEVPLTFAENA